MSCYSNETLSYTYPAPVFIGNVAFLKGPLHTRLILFTNLVITVDILSISITALDQICNLCRCDTSPGYTVSEESQLEEMLLITSVSMTKTHYPGSRPESQSATIPFRS